MPKNDSKIDRPVVLYVMQILTKSDVGNQIGYRSVDSGVNKLNHHRKLTISPVYYNLVHPQSDANAKIYNSNMNLKGGRR